MVLKRTESQLSEAGRTYLVRDGQDGVSMTSEGGTVDAQWVADWICWQQNWENKQKSVFQLIATFMGP
jgi:hypothetical protein